MERAKTPRRGAGRQQGFSLVEVLVAFTVLALGVVSILKFHGVVHTLMGDARNRAQALTLAEARLQELTTWFSPADSRLQPGTQRETVPGRLTEFSRRAAVTASGSGERAIEVTVGWRDRRDREHEVSLATDIRFGAPTEDPGELLRLIVSREQPESDLRWIPASSPPTDESRGSRDDGNDPDNDGDGGDNGSEQDGERPEDEEIEYDRITISGEISAEGNASLEAVHAFGNFFMACRILEGRFQCQTSVADDNSWTGAVYFTPARGAICTPENGSQTYTNITGDQQLDINLARQC